MTSGKYVTFSASGEMPQTLIDLWGEVWSYFSAENCLYERAYTTDFEYYKSAHEVEVSIAVRWLHEKHLSFQGTFSILR